MNDRSQLFMLCLDPLNTTPVTFKWTVTCERCRQDLSGDYDVSPINIINLKGNIPPMQMEQFRRAFRQAIDASPRYPLILNSEGVQHLEVPNLNLQRIVTDHAKVCGLPLEDQPKEVEEPKVGPTCATCRDTGVHDTGNGEFPCPSCDAGDDLWFNTDGATVRGRDLK